MALDVQVLHALNTFALHHDGIEDPARDYAVASEPLFAAGVIALFVAGRRRAAIVAIAATGLALLFAHIGGMLWNRPRPFIAHHAHAFLSHAADSSFPSDHATAAFAIAVAVLVYHRRLGIALLVAAAVLAVARVALGVHYPSDVLAGALLGTLSALALVWLVVPRVAALRPA
jgi:undecaprenyl-diphosphatase